MMRTLKNVVILEYKLKWADMLEHMNIFYARYEKAVKIVDSMLENGQAKRKELKMELKNGTIDKQKYDKEIHDINHCIKNADFKRYLCFTTYIVRYFDGDEDDLASLMNAKGYPLLSKRYIQTPVKIVYSDILDFLFD